MVLASATLMAIAPARAQAPAPQWPVIPMPPEVQRFSVMAPAHINGQLTHTQGYFSGQTPQAIAAWYQQTGSGRWVKNQLGAQTVLGQWSAPYFTTVQIQASGAGSKVLVATTLQSQQSPQSPQISAEGERLLQSLPSDTRLLEHLSTTDPGQSANYYVLDTPAGAAPSIQAVTTWLSTRGYRLQTQSADKQGAHLLQFLGDRREAVVIVGRRPDSSSYLLINDIRRTP